MKTEYDFKEIFKLRNMLDKAKIEYEFIDRSIKDGNRTYTSYQICCPNDVNRYISIVQSFGSYGREDDLLEIMGLLTLEEKTINDVVGYLTAEEVFDRINKYLN